MIDFFLGLGDKVLVLFTVLFEGTERQNSTVIVLGVMASSGEAKEKKSH